MKININQRIQWSFFVLVFLFVASGIITITTVNTHKKLSDHLSQVVDPSLQSLDDLKKILLESKMYATNWVFLRSKEEDKELLRKLHSEDYRVVKEKLNILAPKWKNKYTVNHLKELHIKFEELLVIEKEIMGSLQKFEDYDDPVIKLEAERKIEEEVFPRTSALIDSLHQIISAGQLLRSEENTELISSSVRLQAFIFITISATIGLAIFLSLYLTKIIIRPINQIRYLINDLGKGVTRKIDYATADDEIGKMVNSVNHLSEKLQYTADFAHQIGLRNFNMPFQPLSEEDTLGKALVTMRDNLKAVDESLNEAQHIAGLGSWEWSMTDQTVSWSDELYNIFEVKRGEFTPSFPSYINLIHPDDKEMALADISACFEEHRSFAHELRIITGNNKIKVVNAQGKLGFDKNGERIKMLGIVQDITAQKEGELELKTFNERFKRLSKATNDAIWDWNLITDKVWWNENFFIMLGYDPQKGVPSLSEWTQRLHPAERDEIIKRLILVKEGLNDSIDSWEEEFRYLTNEGVYGTVLDRAYVIKDKEGKPIRIIGALQDITNRKKAEQQIADKNKELLRKNKELEQFAYVASHDLQEPLRTISSFVDMFQQQYKGKLDFTADKFLNYILQASDRMKVLIKDLLDYSRIGGQKEQARIDCNEVLKTVLADLFTAIQETNAEITADHLPVVYGYPTEIKQLFQNLIVNAIKFRKKEAVPQIRITANQKEGGWEFGIHDNGIGIEEEHNERIFVIFQRLHTRSQYEGSGIGLSHCRKIVELHGGKIWVKSNPGEGSTFYFTILENYN